MDLTSESSILKHTIDSRNIDYALSRVRLLEHCYPQSTALKGMRHELEELLKTMAELPGFKRLRALSIEFIQESQYELKGDNDVRTGSNQSNGTGNPQRTQTD